MIAQPYHHHVERTDAERNMARYYIMKISLALFGEIRLTRSWGRIGQNGQTNEHHFERETEQSVCFSRSSGRSGHAVIGRVSHLSAHETGPRLVDLTPCQAPHWRRLTRS